jgi:hypothetical protein
MTSAESYPLDLVEPEGNIPGPDHCPPRSRWAIVSLLVVTVVLLLSPASTLLLYGFPVMVFLLATYLYRRDLVRYVGLVCWLWFLTPLLRRVLDYRVGWIPSTAVLLAPLLALCAPWVWLIAGWRKVIQRDAAPLFCILAACLYGAFLGLVNFPARLVLQDLLFWLAPLVFALTLLRHRERAPELFQAFEKAFLYGTLFVSVYGLLQFFFLPPWDVMWMEQLSDVLTSIGNAKPFEVRVFSTMNSPQALASFLAVGLLISMNSRHRIRFVCIPLGLLCLMLSLARSGWVAMAAGGTYLLFSMPQRQRFRLVISFLLSFVVLAGALQNPDLQQVISQRFESLSDVRNDGSFVDRIDGYRALFAGLNNNPLGLGMGVMPAVAADTTGTVGFVHGGHALNPADSTVAMVLTTMGFAGGLVLLCSFLPLGWRLFNGATANISSTRTIRAVLVALTAEAILDTVVTGPIGFLTWASVGFCIALSVAGREPAIAAGRVVT